MCPGDPSGTHGDTYWKFDDGNIVIGISGSMNDFDEHATKWGNTDIRSVVIYEGVTSIGKCEFANLKNLESATISDSIESIGDNAFINCTSLKSITIPKSVKIGKDILYGTSFASIFP